VKGKNAARLRDLFRDTPIGCCPGCDEPLSLEQNTYCGEPECYALIKLICDESFATGAGAVEVIEGEIARTRAVRIAEANPEILPVEIARDVGVSADLVSKWLERERRQGRNIIRRRASTKGRPKQ
jgi:hypothetical protein